MSTLVNQKVMLSLLRLAQQDLEQIANGNDPSAQMIEDRWQKTDQTLCRLFIQSVSLLPPDVQEVARTCIQLRETIWSMEYLDDYHQAENDAYSSLPTTNERR